MMKLEVLLIDLECSRKFWKNQTRAAKVSTMSSPFGCKKKSKSGRARRTKVYSKIISL